MKTLEKLQNLLKKYGGITLIGAIILIFITFLSLDINKSLTNVEADELVASLYMDEDHQYVDRNLQMEDLERVRKRFENYKETDAASYKEAIDSVEADLGRIIYLESTFKETSFPSLEERSDINDAVSLVNTIEESYRPLANHPVVADISDDYQAYLDELSALVIEEFEYDFYDEELLVAMYSNASLMERFEETPMDPHPLVSLTFDDGPNEEYTLQVLDILDKHGIQGTFFVMGAYVDENPHVAKEIVDRGHIIANHTYNHHDLATLLEEEIDIQIEWTQDSIYDSTGFLPDLYRLPFGSGGERVVSHLSDMTSIMWNTDSMDWALQDANLITDHVLNNLYHHMVLLMHDTSQPTVDALDALIPILQEKGYRFVSPTNLDFYMRHFPEEAEEVQSAGL